MESPNDCTLAGGEGRGSVGETFHLHYRENPVSCLAERAVLVDEYKLWSSSLWSFLQPSVTSSLFGPNILLSILFSNTLSQVFIPSLNYSIYNSSFKCTLYSLAILFQTISFWILDPFTSSREQKPPCSCRPFEHSYPPWLWAILFRDPIEHLLFIRLME
jgi:hypothetical protein